MIVVVDVVVVTVLAASSFASTGHSVAFALHLGPQPDLALVEAFVLVEDSKVVL